jgi:UPF0176 protein
LEKLTPKVSHSDHQPFNRMLVRIKKEIISFGVEGVRPGTYTSPKLAPKELKRWLDEGRPVTLLDTRNDYEVKLGTFKGAIDPNIRTFREFPDAVRQLPEELKNQPIVMFCTGGIRCEKSTALLRQMGFGEVFHLQGGILQYLAQIPPEQSRWQGQCFVFDERVSVGHGLQPGGLGLCRSCREPLSEQSQRSDLFELGVSCPTCHAHTSEDKKTKARERQRQWALQQWRAPLTLD